MRDDRRAKGIVSPRAVATIHYFLAKGVGNARAKRRSIEILSVFQVAIVDGSVVQNALQTGIPILKTLSRQRPYTINIAITS